jgi:hypothetical protein
VDTTCRKAARKVGRDELDGRMGAVCGGDTITPRVASRRDGVDGVLPAASLGVRAMGHGWAVAHGRAPRQAIKQVDRRLSTPPRIREEVARGWGPCGVAERQARCVNVNWTACEDTDQAMIGRGTQREHGRSPPLVWKTVIRSALKDQRQAHEDERLGRLADGLPQGGRVTGVADRGFADIQRYRFLKALGIEYSMRFRGVVDVEAAGRMRVLRGARVTAADQPVPIGVCVQHKQMKEPWRLVSRRSDLTGPAIKHLSSTRFTVEETFRDVKNPRPGPKPTGMARHDRRDVLVLLAGVAHVLLTRRGQAGEALGMDR